MRRRSWERSAGLGPFFHEFVTGCPGDPQALLSRLEGEGILGGYPVEGGILWCVTEMNTKAQIDRLVSVIQEVRATWN